MIKITGLQGSTMSHIQKETEKMATEINTNFKQVIGLDNDVKVLEDTQFYNVNKNLLDNDYILDNDNIFVAYNYLEIAKDVTLEIKYNSTLFIDDINNKNDTTTYEYYSYNEVATKQRWIDGRVIFRKVVFFGALPNVANKTVAHNISSATISSSGSFRFIRLYGCSLNPSANYIPIPYGDNVAANRDVALYVDATNINIYTAYNWSAYTETYITLEYVK